MLFKNSKGFTLIELLIVITIIGILAVSFLPSVLGAPAKARDTARIGHLNQISNAIEAYVLEGNAYPNNARCVKDGTTGWVMSDVKPYISGGNLPKDPSDHNLPELAFPYNRNCDDGEYLYFKFILDSTPNMHYALVAEVENEENGNAATAGDVVKANASAFTAADKGKYYVLVK